MSPENEEQLLRILDSITTVLGNLTFIVKHQGKRIVELERQLGEEK